MSHIDIHRLHELTPEQAREAAETLIAQLSERYEIDYHWQGDSLHFERAGISGQIDLEPGSIRINARLGFLLAPMKSLLEQEIHRQLEHAFYAPPASN